MKLTNNTVLITGGSSGIGLHLSKDLMEKGNTVIICGRSADKLAAAKSNLPNLITYQCDLSKPAECEQLANLIKKNHPTINVLINNAALVNRIDFLKADDALERADTEFQTNLMAPIRLTRLLYNTLNANNEPAIINVTTGLVYVPKAAYPYYNASKAALHSFTQTLRMNINGGKVKVIEVLFPAVDTPWHEGKPPKIAISAEQAVKEMIIGLESGKYEIRIAGVKILYKLFRIAPGFALKKINSLK